MEKFRSHKVVEAAKIVEVTVPGMSDATVTFHLADGSSEDVSIEIGKRLPADNWGSAKGGYLMRYEDGFTSWSPAAAFEGGYTAIDDNAVPGLPVAGYKPTQSKAAVDTVSGNKAAEEASLRILDVLESFPGIDRRWLAIGRTHIEHGWMAVNRAIFKPGRVALPGDEA